MVIAYALLSCSSFALFASAQISIPHVLIYSATAAFRHDSIPTAIEVLKAKGNIIDVAFDSTEDSAKFSDDNLSQYDAVLFLSNTGEVLDSSGKTALQNYLNKGGNFIAIHSASDCLRNTTFYTRDLGALFDFHADLQDAIVDVIGPSHPSTSKLPSVWQVRDEMYNFQSDPRALGAIVVLAANESSYVDSRSRTFDQGTPHPIAWIQERGAGVSDTGIAGRSFYTSLGHLNETWEDETFMSHVLGGISWVLQSNTTRALNSSGLVGSSGSTTTVGVASSGTKATTKPGATSATSIVSSHATKLTASLLCIVSLIYLCLLVS